MIAVWVDSPSREEAESHSRNQRATSANQFILIIATHPSKFPSQTWMTSTIRSPRRRQTMTVSWKSSSLQMKYPLQSHLKTLGPSTMTVRVFENVWFLVNHHMDQTKNLLVPVMHSANFDVRYLSLMNKIVSYKLIAESIPSGLVAKRIEWI